ncbi:hypothetical protein Bca52824_024589 [Brassica carinata]|uniref:Uncharacterized protein n=1 Tax=Brassica carinata TaxID=52824 RepID=A0A8X8AWW3_BRACI|nr:hypothetical protein Bca52824_024589 [Brassica carinata]
MTGTFRARFGGVGPLQDASGLELLHLGGGKEFWKLMKLTSENASGFTSFLELPLTQAVELLHSNDLSWSVQAGISLDISTAASLLQDIDTFPSNSASWRA